LDRLIAPNIARHSAATAGISVTNLEEFKTFLRTDFAAVPDSVMKIDIIFGNDEFVAMRAIYLGTQTGAMGPFPASGKRVELPFIGILRFTNGKISEMWVEWDNVYSLTQLGHLSPPAVE
jgi:predicted ester cyclase